jgi:hypothetical protein
MIVGRKPSIAPKVKVSKNTAQELIIPSIGRIQVLNGCGVPGAANIMADFLRKNRFDVKNIGNAVASSYQKTIIASRNKDISIANQIASVLKTDAVILLRNGDDMYDVTIYVGSDYKEITQ